VSDVESSASPSVPGVPKRLPLTGADCFLRAFDSETRRVNGSSHLSQLVLRLGPGLDLALLESTLERIAQACPIVRAPIRRPGFGAPVYRLDLAASRPLPKIAVHHSALPRGARGFDPGQPLPSVFFERLNAPFQIRDGELLCFDVVRYENGEAGSDLAVTWAHMLMDGSGSENFMAHFAAVAEGNRDAADLPSDEWADGAGLSNTDPAQRETFQKRGERARSWEGHLGSFASAPPTSPAGPLRRVPQELRYGVDWLSEAETAQCSERAKDMAGFLTPMLFYLAAAIRAHAALFRARGATPPSFVVPLPVNVRPKGTEGAFFRTRVSMLWFQVLPEHTETLEGLIEELKLQRRAMIKEGAIENGLAAMDMARYAPMRVYSAMARRGFSGELCSFFFAWTGAFMPDVTSFCGAPIWNGFHTPSVPASPGSSLILCQREARINAAHVHQRGTLSDAELELMNASLRSDLLGLRTE
jgi:hypothetical protein